MLAMVFIPFLYSKYKIEEAMVMYPKNILKIDLIHFQMNVKDGVFWAFHVTILSEYRRKKENIFTTQLS